MRRAALAVLVATACDPAQLSTSTCGNSASPAGGYTYSGVSADVYFALDGARTWRYGNAAADWRLEVALDPGQVEEQGSTRIATLRYSRDTGEALYTARWSSDWDDGVLLHGWAVDGFTPVELDPPVLFAGHRAYRTCEYETTSGGTSWTSTFTDIEPCPNDWVREEWECLVFDLDDGGLGSPVAGTWWLAADWGPSRFQGVADSEPWVLQEATWERTED